MSHRVVRADFAGEADLLRAVRAVRQRGARVVDVYAPYAVHSLDEALGWRPSRLTWACALCGGSAALFMLWFQLWTTGVNWPVNVGGKPLNSLPAYLPVVFEAMVLGGAVGTVAAFFFVARLWPGRRAAPPSARVTDDRFRLIVAQGEMTYDLDAIARTLVEQRGDPVVQDVWPPAAPPAAADPADARRRPVWVPVALGVIVAVLLLAAWMTQRQFTRPHLEYMPTMRRSIPWVPQGPEVTALTIAFPAGTLARDAYPLDYQATAEDAQRAARELTNPFSADDPAALDRGRTVFTNFCIACHGVEGAGDGPVPLRGFPPPPPLTADKSRALADGEIFHIISYGLRLMPAHRHQLSRADRWKVLLHVRALQHAAAAAAATTEPAPASAPESTTSPPAATNVAPPESAGSP